MVSVMEYQILFLLIIILINIIIASLDILNNSKRHRMEIKDIIRKDYVTIIIDQCTIYVTGIPRALQISYNYHRLENWPSKRQMNKNNSFP